MLARVFQEDPPERAELSPWRVMRSGGFAPILELIAVVDLRSGLNKLKDGLQVEPDDKPWYGCGG